MATDVCTIGHWHDENGKTRGLVVYVNGKPIAQFGKDAMPFVIIAAVEVLQENTQPIPRVN